MYTLKSSELKRLTVAEIQAANLPEGRIFQLLLSFVLTKGKGQDLGVSTFIDNEADAINAINSNIARLNDQEALMAKVIAGTLPFEVVAPEVVPPTPEQLQQMKDNEMRQALTQAANDLSIKFFATEAEYLVKVAAIKAATVIPK